MFLQINKERVGNFILESEGGYRDIAMLEECDKAVATICRLCNWTWELEQLVKQNDSETIASAPKKQSKHLPQVSKTIVKARTPKETSQHSTARTKTAFESAYAPKSPRKK